MTEKRFTIELYKDFTEWYDRLTDNATGFPPNRYHWLVDKEKIIDLMNSLADENEQLKTELKGMEELLNSYRKTIKHDAELLADATKNGYLPPIKGGYFE